MHARARNDVWAAGDGGVVLRWDGTRWTQTPTTSPADPVNAIWASAADEAWLALDRKVWRWDGQRWTDTGQPAGQEIAHIWATGPRDVWMFGVGAMRWDGTNWRGVPVRGAPVGAMNLAGWVSATGEVWLGGGQGRLGRGNSQEISTVSTGFPDGNLRSVWSSGAGDAIAVGDFAVRWDGQSWQAIPAGRALNAVWGTSPSSVWAVGDNGLVMFWNGQAWSVLTTGIPSSPYLSFNTITGSGPDDIWAFGRSGNHAHFDGQQWTSGPTAAVGNINSAWASGRGDVWAAAENGSVVRRTAGGWEVLRINHPDARRLSGIWGNSNTDVWVLGSLESAFHWDGMKFTPVTVPGGGLTAIGGGGASTYGSPRTGAACFTGRAAPGSRCTRWPPAGCRACGWARTARPGRSATRRPSCAARPLADTD